MIRQLLRNDGIECREEDPWDVFIPDEDECDPEPEPGDFWADPHLPFPDFDQLAGQRALQQREVLSCSL